MLKILILTYNMGAIFLARIYDFRSLSDLVFTIDRGHRSIYIRISPFDRGAIRVMIHFGLLHLLMMMTCGSKGWPMVIVLHHTC